jgi:chitodextrinase
MVIDQRTKPASGDTVKHFLRQIVLCALIAQINAAVYYVDSSVSASGNGLSWGTAWKGVTDAAGLHAGDTVFISGGSTSQIYRTIDWRPPSGDVGNPIRFRVGQESGRNGTVIFDGAGSNYWIFANENFRFANVVVDGEVAGSNHMLLRNYLANTVNLDAGATNFTLRFITAFAPLRAYHCNGIVYDHLTVGPTVGVDGLVVGMGSGSGYTSNAIRDCTFYAYYRHGVNASGGNGDDVMQNIQAVTVSKCRFIGVYTADYVGSQHQDGIQCAGWVKVESCYFENMANYAFFGEFWGSGGNIQLFNNVFNFSDPVLTAQPSCCIAIGTSARGLTLSNIIVANNTLRGGGRGISLGGGYPDTTTTASYVVNNLLYNTNFELISSNPGGVPQLSGNGITRINNKAQNGTTVSTSINNAGSSNSNPVTFVNVAANDFHLASSDLGAKDQGSAWPATYISTDKEGNSRPQGAAWDIGAHEYASVGVAAVTYHVRKDGSDTTCNGLTNASAAAAPNGAFLTVQKAVNMAQPGNTIIVHAGDYSSTRITSVRTGTAVARITLMAAPGESVTLGGVTLSSGHDYITVQGFRVTQSGGMGTLIRINNAYAVLRSNYIFSSSASDYGSSVAISFSGTSSHAIIDANTLDGNNVATSTSGPSIFIPVNIHGSNHLITKNTVRNIIDCERVFETNGTGITISGNEVYNLWSKNNNIAHVDIFQNFFATNGADYLIEKNYFHDIDGQMGNYESEGLVTGKFLYRNNVFANITSSFFIHTPYHYFYNNTFYRCGTGLSHPIIEYGPGFAGGNCPGAFNMIYKNNVFYACGSSQYGGWYDMVHSSSIADYNYVATASNGAKSGFSETHGVNGGDPKFISATGQNFRLQSGSVLIGKGVDLSSLFTADLDGNPRTGSWDIGAFEFGGTVPPADITAPSAPLNLTASTVSSSQINLAWNAATDNVGVTGYRISRGGVQIATVTGTSYQNSGLTASTTYSYTVKAVDAAGNESPASAAVSATTQPMVTPGGTGTGLTGQYFDNKDFTGASISRTDATVNFNWALGSPSSSIGVDTYSARWTGQVQAQYSQTYTFHVTGDDGVRLWVNGILLIDKWIDQAATEWSGSIALTAGTKYVLKLEYYENLGYAASQLRWSSGSTPKAIIPSSQLYPGATPVNTGLVALWKLDESGEAMIAADSSGNGFNGTLGHYPAPGWKTGKINGALNFNGVSNIVTVGSPSVLTNLARYTIAAWIKPRSFGEASLGRIVNKRNSGTAGWTLFLTSQGSAFFRQTFSTTSGAWSTSNNAVTLGGWQHVALTYDNSSAANRPVFYLNGTRVTTTAKTAPAGSVTSDAASPLTIGNTATLDRTFDGGIDDVRIYNRILSAAEVGALVVPMPTGTG